MEITRGRIAKAKKVVLYGPEGIGKSTFAAQFPAPVFIDTEGSTNSMDVARFPRPTSWTMLMGEVDEAMRNPSICKTLVIDTADWAERMCIEQACAELKINGIEDLGYGKGYVYVAEKFGKLLNLLEEVTRNGVNVVITAHAMMRKFERPDELSAYDRWELKLSKKVAPMVKEWSDLLLFANYQTYVTVTKDNKRKAVGGERVMYTTHHACWDAKNRFNLPDMLPFEYAQIKNVIEDAAVPSTETKTPPSANLVENDGKGEISSAEPTQPTQNAENKAPDEWRGIPDALKDLMMRDKVTPFELQAAVAGKGYYPMSASIAVYDPSFVQGCLIGAWEQVRQIVYDTREQKPF